MYMTVYIFQPVEINKCATHKSKIKSTGRSRKKGKLLENFSQQQLGWEFIELSGWWSGRYLLCGIYKQLKCGKHHVREIMLFVLGSIVFPFSVAKTKIQEPLFASQHKTFAKGVFGNRE